LQRLKDLDKEQ